MDHYRVLESTRSRDREELLLLAVDTADPTYVPADGYESPLAETVAAVDPGNRVRARIDWGGERPRLAAAEIVETTRFAFARDATNLFDAAVDCWEATAAAGEAMNSTLTRGTDGEVNGVCYVFADQPGRRDLFEEFRDGHKPLEPLLDRIEGAEPPYELFVIDPREGPFVVVYIALERGGLLARTVRETYDFDGDGDGAGGDGAPDGIDGLSDLGGFDG